MNGKYSYSKGDKATAVILSLLGMPLAGAAIGSVVQGVLGGGQKERGLRGAEIGGGIGIIVGLVSAVDAMRSMPTR